MVPKLRDHSAAPVRASSAFASCTPKYAFVVTNTLPSPAVTGLRAAVDTVVDQSSWNTLGSIDTGLYPVWLAFPWYVVHSTASLQSASGCSTVMVSAANTPPLDAVTIAIPGETPVTSPAELTVTMDAGALDHVTAAPGMT